MDRSWHGKDDHRSSEDQKFECEDALLDAVEENCGFVDGYFDLADFSRRSVEEQSRREDGHFDELEECCRLNFASPLAVVRHGFERGEKCDGVLERKSNPKNQADMGRISLYCRAGLCKLWA